MAEFKNIIFLLLMKIEMGVAEGITMNVFCNTKQQTWTEARDGCISVGGNLVAYETGLGVDINKLPLKKTMDVWTADYALQTKEQYNKERLCGFVYQTNDWLFPTEMFGSCYANRYYLCERKDNGLDVLNGTRESILCNDPIDTSLLFNNRQKIIPGYYWTKNIVDAKTEVVQKLTQTPVQSPYLCGAYTANIGKYFVSCTTKRQSLCFSDPDNAYKDIDKSCFVEGNPSTVRTESTITLSTSTEANEKPSTSYDSSTVSTGSSITCSTSTEIKESSSVKHYVDTVAPGIGKKQDLGLSVGLPLGLCVAVIGGVTLSIFVIRRYKCCKLERIDCRNKETVLSNNASSTTQSTVYFNNSYERSSTHIFESKHMNESTQTSVKRMQNSIPEYAVVRKKPIRHVQQGQTGHFSSKEKNKPLHDPVNTMDTYYCYTTVDVDPFLNSNAVQTSEYSFARETEGDLENDDDGQSNVSDEEYDVTRNPKHVNTSNNIYNTLQKEEYGTSLSVGRGDNTYNILDMPNDHGSQTIYDTSNHLDHSFVTNNIYTHLKY